MRKFAILLLFWSSCVSVLATPPVSVTFSSPPTNALESYTISVAVYVTSTYELQGVQVTCGANTTNLIYSSSAGWTNILSLAGVPHGSNIITATATDVFNNTGQATRVINHDTPPILTVSLPVLDTVARPNLKVSASSADDDPVNPPVVTIQEYDINGYAGPQLATASNSIDTNLSIVGYDGQELYLQISATDSAGQRTNQRVRISVQSSTNLVEVAHVSQGRISDVSSDQILFVVDAVGTNSPSIRVQTRVNGTESVIYAGTPAAYGPTCLAPQGAVSEMAGSLEDPPHGYSIFQCQSGATNEEVYTYGSSMNLLVRGSYAAYNWSDGGGVYPTVGLINLNNQYDQTVTTLTTGGDFMVDLATNGNVVYVSELNPGQGGHAVYLWSEGNTRVVASDPTNTFFNPKTDGTNVCYTLATSTNQQLILIDGNDQTNVLAQSSSMGSDTLMKNGWIAYEATGGGSTQIWRRSPTGQTTQLTYYGSSSALVALSPNGEVALSNGGELYISKGIFPPFPIAATSFAAPLVPFWLDDRWYAPVGRSLYQVYTGYPIMLNPHLSSSNTFNVDVVGAIGQNLVIQSSSDGQKWTDISTNTIADGMNPTLQFPINSHAAACFYRLRTH